MQNTNNLNVAETRSLITPAQLKREVPITEEATNTVVSSREIIKNILDKKDQRLLAIVGPCSIHDEKVAMEYANLIKNLANKINEKIFLVMRVYFEKPRTSVGWKGFINDPNLDGSFDIEQGLRKARNLLVNINAMGVAASTEMLDTIIPQYIADLISWGAIGARTTESQIHREMASGLSMPIGFKNNTFGSIMTAAYAMQSAQNSHHFIGINQDSVVSIFKTKGNKYSHVVLRGGEKPNFDAVSIRETEDALKKVGLREAIMVDCSHSNSNKQHENQELVLNDIIWQKLDNNQSIIGFMLESNLKAGNQPLKKLEELEYGVSITDKCLDWENTERILLETFEKLK